MDNKLLMQAASNNNQQGYKHSKIGDELKNALNDTRIKSVTDQELRSTLKGIMLLVGMRAQSLLAMEEEEKLVLTCFIRENYSGHTLSEFKMAFTKAVAGDLDVDARTFENFSCEYVGRIMKAYRKWASTQYTETGLYATVAPVSRQIERNYHPLELVQTIYEEFLEGKHNIELIPARAFDIAKEWCKIEFTDKELFEFVRKARLHVLNQYSKLKQNAKNYESLKNIPVGESCNDDYVNRYAKALCLVEWFDRIRQEGITGIVNYYAQKQN